MNSTAAGWLQFLLLFAALAACYVPLGNWIARIFTDKNHWRVERGETGPVLVDVASEPEDLLVIGTGRRGVVRRLCRGSVGRYCLAHARCPVLAVPPSALMDEVGHGLRSWHLRRHVLIPGV